MSPVLRLMHYTHGLCFSVCFIKHLNLWITSVGCSSYSKVLRKGGEMSLVEGITPHSRQKCQSNHMLFKDDERCPNTLKYWCFLQLPLHVAIVMHRRPINCSSDHLPQVTLCWGICSIMSGAKAAGSLEKLGSYPLNPLIKGSYQIFSGV